MKRIKQLMVAVLGTLAATWDRLTKPAGFALPNELALMNEHGVETLIINAGTAPVSSRCSISAGRAGRISATSARRAICRWAFRAIHLTRTRIW